MLLTKKKKKGKAETQTSFHFWGNIFKFKRAVHSSGKDIILKKIGHLRVFYIHF